MSEYQAVVDIIFGRWKSQILYAGVKLGVFDSVTRIPTDSGVIAKELHLDALLCYRLLRALGSMGLLKEHEGKSFSVTPTGELLRRDADQTLRGVALLEEGPEHYAIWKHLPSMIQDGIQDGFIREFGQRLFDYLSNNPSYAGVFNEAMSSYSSNQTKWVLEALDDYDFSKIKHVCDIGGGHGHLLCNLLLDIPTLGGTVLEQAWVIDNKELLWANKMGIGPDRCKYASGDMFNEVPAADAYFMKMILHDWSDKECLQILTNIAKACSSGSRLFVVEHIVPGPETPHFSKLFDIHMLCALTGRERTEKEYSDLLKQSGFIVTKTHYPKSGMIGVIEAVRQ